MKKVRVIGTGSDFGEDRLGWQAIEVLQQSGLAQSCPAADIGFHFCARPGNELLDLLRGADQVILIDAMRSEAEPGTIRRFAADDFDALPAPLSSHILGLREALQIAAALGELPPHSIVFGIEMARGNQRFDYRAAPQARVDWLQLARQIEREINNPVLIGEEQ